MKLLTFTWFSHELRRLNFCWSNVHKTIQIDIHFVKELPSLCKLQNDKQEVRSVNHILKQGVSQQNRREGEKFGWNTSKLMIQGWLTDWRIRTSFNTDVELQELKDLTFQRKKDSWLKSYLTPPLNVVAVVFLQIILMATLTRKYFTSLKTISADQPIDSSIKVDIQGCHWYR